MVTTIAAIASEMQYKLWLASIFWFLMIRMTGVFENLFYFTIVKFFEFYDWLIRWLGVGPFC